MWPRCTRDLIPSSACGAIDGNIWNHGILARLIFRKLSVQFRWQEVPLIETVANIRPTLRTFLRSGPPSVCRVKGTSIIKRHGFTVWRRETRVVAVVCCLWPRKFMCHQLTLTTVSNKAPRQLTKIVVWMAPVCSWRAILCPGGAWYLIPCSTGSTSDADVWNVPRPGQGAEVATPPLHQEKSNLDTSSELIQANQGPIFWCVEMRCAEVIGSNEGSHDLILQRQSAKHISWLQLILSYCRTMSNPSLFH